MVLGTIMEIVLFIMGIGFLFIDKVFAFLLMGILILFWILGTAWDKVLFGDYFYSWRSLSKLWKGEDKS